MRKSFILAAATLSLLVIAGATWWLWPLHAPDRDTASSSNTGRILYYQAPSGTPDYSPVPKKDKRGRNYIAVRGTAEVKPATERKVLYYRNPMGLADTSAVPKKDSMGMDYIPVFADEGAEEPGTVKISLDRVQRLGIRTAKATRQAVSESVVLTGTVTADERRLGVVTLKFPANVMKLHVAATGETVRKGQPLFDIQSPFILKEELDLALALRARDVAEDQGGVVARSNARSISATRQRLQLYEVPDSEIERLISTQEPTGYITWPAPQNGVVIEKAIVAGMQADAGMVLYRLADLSNVWVIAEAPENALAIARSGADAHITLNAFPGKTFEGKITFVYPEVSMTTRTAKVRIELANRDGLLLPGMFASVEIASPQAVPVLTVPDSALIDSGTRQVVLVVRGDGAFQPRAVTVGRRSNGMTEVMSGLDGGEEVVTSATFLIDAESNLRAALQSFTANAPPTKEIVP